MDDSCAVCAESLEWVAYGRCGHRDVCSTCVARLRFICDDRRCCICKTESDIVFITKALGDYTRMIVDFSVFPSNSTEGQNGSYWYHEDTGAYFDDSDHYKMIKAMCRLSCSVCDKMENQGGNDGPKRRGKFRNIEQLKSHLYHRHKLLMCNLCLEGRKIFICEQKLYTRSQLNQHINTGDSEVDGSESERGGFMGHPMCEFCRKPFYGDNELYTHMSTEHFTCHICQRQHPGQYEYYKNYDDLEIHFRQQHFLCEDEACLAKKFIVFPSESEMKRHNAIEHGGNMSRSKRNAVLQIPTSFRYRRSNEQDHRRGRGRALRLDASENQLSLAIQASLETANLDNAIHDPSSSAQLVPDHRETSEDDEILGPFESLATTDSEGSSRYLQALGHSSRNVPLEESSFPPLPMAPANIQQKPKNDSEGLGKSTMADRLRRRRKGTVKVLNSSQAWSATNQGLASSSSNSALSRPKTNFGLVSSSSSATSLQTNSAIMNGPIPSSYASSATGHGVASASSASYPWNSSNSTRPAAGHGVASGSSASSPWNSSSSSRPVAGHGVASVSSASSQWNSSSSTRISHSASAPNLVERGSLDSSLSDFPPVSATQKSKLPTNSQPMLKVEDVHTANKSLVEMIRSALGSDESKYTAFKDISAEYRLGVIDTVEYLSYVQQFGLSHLVLELARLCPDARRQRELIETYNASVKYDSMRANGLGNSGIHTKEGKASNKSKGRSVEEADSSSRDTLADSIISTVRKLQASYKPSEEEVVEVLSKDGYRASKGKSKAAVAEEQLGSSSASKKPANSADGQNDTQPVGVASKQNSGGGGGKQRKKIPKFQRVRLGDGADFVSEREEETTHSEENPSEGLPVRGVWRNGGGQRLVTKTQKDLAK